MEHRNCMVTVMPDQREHWIFLRSELDRLPGTLPSEGDLVNGLEFNGEHVRDRKDMTDEEVVFHHACVTHFRSLSTISRMLRDAWFDAELELRGSTLGQEDDEVELLFSERLAAWLRDHAAYVACVAAGGEIDPCRVKAGHRQLELYLAGHRLYAERHHEMVAGYCDRVATSLEHRAAELRGRMSCAA